MIIKMFWGEEQLLINLRTVIFSWNRNFFAIWAVKRHVSITTPILEGSIDIFMPFLATWI